MRYAVPRPWTTAASRSARRSSSASPAGWPNVSLYGLKPSRSKSASTIAAGPLGGQERRQVGDQGAPVVQSGERIGQGLLTAHGEQPLVLPGELLGGRPRSDGAAVEEGERARQDQDRHDRADGRLRPRAGGAGGVGVCGLGQERGRERELPLRDAHHLLRGGAVAGRGARPGARCAGASRSCRATPAAPGGGPAGGGRLRARRASGSPGAHPCAAGAARRRATRPCSCAPRGARTGAPAGRP